MQARLLETSEETLLFLENGAVFAASKTVLFYLLFNFKKLSYEDISASGKQLPNDWRKEHLDLGIIPGNTLAYVTDSFDLVIVNFAPFVSLFDDIQYTSEDYCSVQEYAKKHNKSVEQVKVFCRKGRILGAKKIGRDWVIPTSSPYPYDKRRA